METYNTKTAVYDVFSANMTLDTNTEGSYSVISLACKSCQQCRHQCFGCRTGLIGERLEDSLDDSQVEKILESLLKAA